MSTTISTAVALKEWAVCEAALTAGRTIMLLRKGGIREAARQFQVEHTAFSLYPTYEHQRLDLLKPAFQPLLAATLAEAPPEGIVQIRTWLEVTDGFELMEAEQLHALTPYHMWTDSYAEERLRWRPRRPLHVLLVRAYRLSAPLTLPYESRYGGCTSWVDLTNAPDLAGRMPVMDDATYEAMAQPVRQLLAGLPTSTPRA